jgi:hypothetical protein
MYFYPNYQKEELGIVVISFGIAILLPPFGWMRPHPYTDIPGNTPYRMMSSGSKKGE